MLKEIALITKFNFTIYQVKDGKYGAKNKKGEWNGLVGELITGKADLALASLTINLARAQVVDLSKPFLNLGLSILFKRPEPRAPKLFSFMAPLHFDIWICIFLAYLVTSLIIYTNACLSPFEWLKSKDEDGEFFENQFTLSNSFWYMLTSFFHSGAGINAHSPSCRILHCIWSFFTLVLTALYTANLAAFLTVQSFVMPINNANDLSMQASIKYGCLAGGSSEAFFRVSYSLIFYCIILCSFRIDFILVGLRNQKFQFMKRCGHS